MHRRFIVLVCFIIYSTAHIDIFAQSQDQREETQNIENFPNIKNDDFPLNELTINLLSDSILRDKVFPNEFTFDLIPDLINQRNIQLAAWHLVHLYKVDQKKTLQLFKVLVKYFPYKNLIIDSYKIYAYADPHILSYIDGVPILLDPKKFEDITHRTNGLNTIYNFYIEKNKNENPKSND